MVGALKLRIVRGSFERERQARDLLIQRRDLGVVKRATGTTFLVASECVGDELIELVEQDGLLEQAEGMLVQGVDRDFLGGKTRSR